jgi:hypothetical protein
MLLVITKLFIFPWANSFFIQFPHSSLIPSSTIPDILNLLPLFVICDFVCPLQQQLPVTPFKRVWALHIFLSAKCRKFKAVIDLFFFLKRSRSFYTLFSIVYNSSLKCQALCNWQDFKSIFPTFHSKLSSFPIHEKCLMQKKKEGKTKDCLHSIELLRCSKFGGKGSN